MKTLIFSLVLGFASSVYSDESEKFSKGLVKISSSACEDATVVFHGSGLAFTEGEKTYVITSEHVVIHSGRGFCHSVESPELGKVPALLVSADWGTGLALLKLEGTFALPSLATLQTIAIKEGDSLTSAGYPFHSYDSPIKDPRCTLLSAQSKRAYIPLVPYYLEVQGCRVEYGMSGGIAFSNRGGMAGIISHQLLRSRVGGPAEVVTLESNLVPDDHQFFVIPWPFVTKWISGILTKTVPTSAVRDPLSQLNGLNREILSRGLRFQSDVKPVSREDSRTRGGSDGTGIGGSDGSGVGGNSTSTQGEVPAVHRIQIRITATQAAAGASYPLQLRAKWFDQLRKETLRPDGVVNIPYFIEWSNESIPSARRHYFHSLAEFFTLLARPELEPVSLVQNSSSNDLSKLTKTLLSLGERLTDARLKLDLNALESDLEVGKLQNQLNILEGLLLAGEGDLISLPWLTRLQDTGSAGWKHMAAKDFNATVQILFILNETKTELAKHQL